MALFLSLLLKVGDCTQKDSFDGHGTRVGQITVSPQTQKKKKGLLYLGKEQFALVFLVLTYIWESIPSVYLHLGKV